MEDKLVRYTSESGTEIELSPTTVREYLTNGNGQLTDQEVVMFLELCRAQRLNPFLREAYVIKFGSSPASIVTGKETFMKRAERHPQFDGVEAGVTVAAKDGDDVTLERRDGSLVGGRSEKLVGGWAKVYRKDRAHPFFVEVSFEEYVARTSDGKPNKQWTRMPGTMIRKVALVQALREAFPEAFGGLYSLEEISEVDSSTLPDSHVEAPKTAATDPIVDEAVEAEWEEGDE